MAAGDRGPRGPPRSSHPDTLNARTLGLLVFPSRLPGVALAALAVAGVLTFVARPMAVLATATPARDIGWRESVVLGWTGLRGAVPIVLATFPFAVGHPGAQDIFDVVFFVVLVSTLLQGATVTPLVKALGLAADRPGWAPVAEALPLEGVNVDLVEVAITVDLPVANQQLKDVPPPVGMNVVTIIREGHAVIPRGTTRLLPGDLALLAVEPKVVLPTGPRRGHGANWRRTPTAPARGKRRR